MPRNRTEFAQGVLNAYRSYGLAETTLSKSMRASAGVAGSMGARPMGHPAFANLPLDGAGDCDGTVMFLDLDDFTGRTFWESPASVVRLARAVLTQLVEVIIDHGGHVLGLRGDGVFACFGGPGSDPRIDVPVALGAAAFALDATEGALNNMLRLSGLDPVRLRVGADHGRLDFVRTGTDQASEINVISFAANFAAKCEKAANSWELVVGEELAAYVPDKRLIVAHKESPRRYQRDHSRRAYAFYDVAWRSIAPHAIGVPEDLAGEPTSSVHLR